MNLSGGETGKAEFRKDPAAMDTKEQLIQGLFDAGCTMEAAKQIGSLYETGSYREMLHQMKVQRCSLIEQMHKSQRRVDRMDILIRNQEKRMK